MAARSEEIAARQADHEPVLPEPGMQWPDARSRRIFEAQMLSWHAEELERRYPETVWPASGGAGGTERDMHAAQAAFVAGIRFAAQYLHGAVSEQLDRIAELEEAVSQ
jgi:hypothetical protein